LSQIGLGIHLPQSRWRFGLLLLQLESRAIGCLL
jgi:hypothetical protein